MNCPSCDAELSERGSFCKECGEQARCTNCRDVLEKNASACVECGTKIGRPQNEPFTVSNATSGTSSFVLPPNRNNVNFHEDKNSRRFEASLTDEALTSIGDVFGYLFAQRDGHKVIPALHRRQRFDQPPRPLPELPVPSDAADESAVVTASSSTPPNGTHVDKARILRIFTPKNETFELSDNRLKASNGSDYLRRLTYLYLYAQELHGRNSAPESDLKEVLKNAKMIDRAGNAYKWLNKRIGIATEGEDHVKLNIKGREEAQKALEEALDSKIADVYNPDTRVPKKRAARGKKK